MSTTREPLRPRQEAGDCAFSLRQLGDRTVEIALTGYLDQRAATAVGRACNQLLENEPKRLEIDLGGLTGSCAEGETALERCLEVGRRLPEGVGVRMVSRVGRRLLLSSLPTV